jgi:diacylglycerol O-acyltransferase / wax synthase
MLEDPDLGQDAGAAWSGAATMSDMEALMWRCESSPRLRSGGVLMEILDRSPEWGRIVATHEWAVSVVPRLRDRVVDDPLLVAAPEWVEDDGFDLAYHLRHMQLPQPGGIDDLLAIAQVMAMGPFDRARPLWEAVLVEGLSNGRAAYLLKLHHSLLDGAALIQLFDILHPAQPDVRPNPQRTTGEPRLTREAPSLLEKRMEVLAGATRAGAGTVLGLSGDLIRRPEPTLDAAVRFVQSLARLAGPPPASPSPLMTQRGISRRLRMLDVPLPWMRATGKATGGSVNDVFLAALTGALRLYHEQAGAGAVPDELPIGFPVSLRRADDPLGGNRFSGARIAAPVGTIDPRERIQLIRDQVLEARDEPAIDFVARLSPFLARIPAGIVTRMTERVTRSIDLQASNFPGLARPAYLAGARVTRMYPFGPAPGSAAMVTMLSHNGICCVGITADAAAIGDVDRFAACVRAGFDEVLALAGHSLEDVTDDPGELVGVGGS